MSAVYNYLQVRLPECGATFIADAPKERKRKKKPAKIVTFDDEELSSLSASPASLVVSPVQSEASVHQDSAASSSFMSAAEPEATSSSSSFIRSHPSSHFYADLPTSSAHDNGGSYAENHRQTANGSSKSSFSFSPPRPTASQDDGLARRDEQSDFGFDGRRVESNTATKALDFDVYGSQRRNHVSLDQYESTVLGKVLSTSNIDCVVARSGSGHTVGNAGGNAAESLLSKSEVARGQSGLTSLKHSSSATSNVSMASSCSSVEYT